MLDIKCLMQNPFKADPNHPEPEEWMKNWKRQNRFRSKRKRGKESDEEEEEKTSNKKHHL